MSTMIPCPQCQTPIAAQLVQIIDADMMPEAKQALLSGQINVAQCQSCQWVGQIGTPMLYHDSAHDLLMVFLPMNSNLSYDEEQKFIGSLTHPLIENIPQEKRKMYLLQPPQRMTRWEAFIERVLETEGVTKEMIDRQKRQMALVTTLSSAEPTDLTALIADNSGDIDETFFQIIQHSLENAGRNNDTQSLIALTNVNATLIATTDAGKKYEKKRIALHHFQIDAKAAEGLSPELMLKHILANQEDAGVIDAIVAAGRSALTYEFFTGISAEIEDKARAHDKEAVNRLTALRTKLLAIHDEMREASEAVLNAATETLEALLSADDTEAAIQANAGKLDEAFSYVLRASVEQARSNNDSARLAKLETLQESLNNAMLNAMPPEMRAIGEMLEAKDDDGVRAVINANQGMFTKEFMPVFDELAGQFAESGNEMAAERLKQIKAVVELSL